MNTPWELPVGLKWRELDERDASWWATHKNACPISECAAFNLTYVLRDPDTGETRVVIDRGIPFDPTKHERDDYLSSTAFYFTEGNAGCGCNRRIFWALAIGDGHPGDDVVCDRHHVIVEPRWLAAIDEDPCARFEDPKPWDVP